MFGTWRMFAVSHIQVNEHSTWQLVAHWSTHSSKHSGVLIALIKRILSIFWVWLWWSGQQVSVALFGLLWEIWNPSHVLHKNRNEIHDAWKRIQDNLGVNCSIADIKKKKESLMASFRTCLNKMKQSNRSGAGPDDVFRPNWFAFEKMASFLKARDQPRKSINSEVSQSKNRPN